ncbi:Receptor expression-enhancing protein [Dirofilaria immitis]|nr:Receptor expression-enhancing protein [Dirofilaria immitis]
MLDKVLYSKDYTFMDRAFCCIEHKTMIRREQIFYAAIFLLIALLLVQNFDPLLCAVVSCLYPAYETTKSLTMRSNEEYKQRKHWLIYWIMLFLMLLALPQTGVAELCYCDIVVPVLSIVNNAFLKYNWQSNNVTHVTANGSKENDQ